MTDDVLKEFRVRGRITLTRIVFDATDRSLCEAVIFRTALCYIDLDVLHSTRLIYSVENLEEEAFYTWLKF